jgi:hypothetical protein
MIDIFKVGVHIGMTTNSSQVLSIMLQQLTGLHTSAAQLSASLNGVRKAAIGVGQVFIGWEVGKSIWHAIEGNRELNKELEKTKQLGGDFAARVGQTRAAAQRTVNDTPTSTFANNVRLAREIGQTLGHPEGAEEMLSAASKTAFLVHNYTGEDEESVIKNLIRTADLRGQVYSMGADGKEHVDAKKLTAELDAAYRGLVLGGGFATSEGMLQSAKMGGAVVKEQTPEAFYAAGTEAGIAMGASRLGTAETSLMAQFIGGTMTKKVAEHLTEAGLLHSNEWHSGKSGGVVVNPSVAQRFEPMMKDPVAWLETGEGGQAIKAYALKEGVTATAAIMQLFGRQTTQRLASDAMNNEPQFARAREIWGNVPSAEAAYKEQMNGNLDANITAVTAAWKSFMEAFGDASVPLVIPILHGLTEAIHFFMNAVADHPNIVMTFTGLVGALAALTALSGAIAVFSVAIGPLVTGLGALGALTGLGTVGAAIGGIAGGLARLAAIASGPGAAALAIGSIMKPSATNVGEENTPGYADRFGNKDPNHLGSSPYVKPSSDSQPVQLRGTVTMDKRTVGDIVADSMADRMTRAPTGSPGADLRVSPRMPGALGVFQ